MRNEMSAAQLTAQSSTNPNINNNNNNKSSSSASSNGSLVIPHEFVWKHGGQRVILTGSFDNWQKTVIMKPELGDLTIFKAIVPLDPSKSYQFKYVVDDIWRCSLDFETCTDEHGNVNNYLPPTSSYIATTNSLNQASSSVPLNVNNTSNTSSNNNNNNYLTSNASILPGANGATPKLAANVKGVVVLGNGEKTAAVEKLQQGDDGRIPILLKK